MRWSLFSDHEPEGLYDDGYLCSIRSPADEVKAYIKEKFADVLATKSKGAIMKAVMADMKGKADGKVINQTVAELCK